LQYYDFKVLSSVTPKQKPEASRISLRKECAIKEAESQRGRLGHFLARWIDGVVYWAPWLLALVALATVAIFFYTLNNLSIRTDTGKMLSESLPFRKSWREYKKAFPQYLDTILLVIDGETPDLAQYASKTLASRLKGESALFKTVYLPGGDTYFEEHALLYMSLEELEDLTDNLARVQPYLAKLAGSQTLRGFFSLLTSAIEAVRYGVDFDLSLIFDRVSVAIQETLTHRFYQLSWQELMLGHRSDREDRRRIIVAQPRLSRSEPWRGQRALKKIRRLVEELHLTSERGVRVRVTGQVALEYEELRTLSRGAAFGGLLAVLLVTIVLYIGLGSTSLVFATLITLFIGLTWTAGFAFAALGHLNLISVAFAVLYIGLSVDYAIHFCLRYLELTQQGRAHINALRAAGQDTGSSLVICAISTAMGFYAFLPTAFIGVSELGLIAGTGMFISLFANLTVLPALLSLMPPSPRTLKSDKGLRRLGAQLLNLPFSHARAIRFGALLLGLGGLMLLPQLTFDYNPLTLRDPDTESVSTYADLFAESKTSPWSIIVIAPNEETAEDYKVRLNSVEQVRRSITLRDFIPQQQEDKLSIIEEIKLILGPNLLVSSAHTRPAQNQQTPAFHDLMGELHRFLEVNQDSELVASASRLYRNLELFESALGTAAQPSEMISNLENSLIGSLPELLRGLEKSLRAGPVTMGDLPKDLITRWKSKDGQYLIKLLPRENLNDNEALNRFVSAVLKVVPTATGAAVISLESGKAVVKAFQQALVLSLIAITTLLLLLSRRTSDTLLVLMPLILAGILTGAAMVLLNISFNFANVIALPLLLGIGVDSSIHMVHRYRTAPPDSGNVLQTSAARGVLFSGLTTFCSFGNLAFSNHPGMASMGLLLSIGLVFTLICTLVVLPALLGTVVLGHLMLRVSGEQQK
jgi:hopanoid biosynthesis associated RND transporter like protein HpnN